MTYNVLSGTLNPTIPYRTIPSQRKPWTFCVISEHSVAFCQMLGWIFFAANCTWLLVFCSGCFIAVLKHCRSQRVSPPTNVISKGVIAHCQCAGFYNCVLKPACVHVYIQCKVWCCRESVTTFDLRCDLETCLHTLRYYCL